MHAEAFFKALGVGGKYGSESRLGGEAVTAHPRFDPDTGEPVFSHGFDNNGAHIANT